MRNTSIVGGDFINNCIVIKLDDYDTEISVINRKMGKINIIDNFEIEIGIKHLISLEAKKEFIKIITSKLNDYKHLKEIFFSVQNEDVIIREYPEIQRVKKRDLDGYVNFEIVKDMPVNIEQSIKFAKKYYGYTVNFVSEIYRKNMYRNSKKSKYKT